MYHLSPQTVHLLRYTIFCNVNLPLNTKSHEAEYKQRLMNMDPSGSSREEKESIDRNCTKLYYASLMLNFLYVTTVAPILLDALITLGTLIHDFIAERQSSSYARIHPD